MNNTPQERRILEYILDVIIFIMLYLMCFIDIINGYFIHQNISLPISISQIYKLTFIVLVLTSFLISNAFKLLNFLLIFLLLIPGPLISVLLYGNHGFFKDIVLIFKFLTPVLMYFYFKNIIKRNSLFFISNIKKILFINFIIIAVNLVIGSFGYGYQQYADYSTGASIGTIGYFYAGNELSVLMIVIFSLLSAFVFMKYPKSYILFSALLLCLSILKATKAAILGVLIVVIGVPFWIGFKRKLYKYLVTNLLLFIILPTVSYFLYFGVVKTGLYNKLLISFTKYDLITFIYSNRNNFALNGWKVFNEQYYFINRLFGVGQQYYMKIAYKASEIDFIDILFYFGYFGVIFLTGLIIVMLYKSYSQIKNKSSIFAKYSFFMILLLFFVSLIAGHTFSSGLAGPFIGLIFALPYYKVNK